MYTLNRQIESNSDYEVIVVGGGPAGCAAAAASSRGGAKTLLIEAGGALGGMGTLGLVPAWCPFSDGEKIIYRGLAEKVFLAANAGVPHVNKGDLDWVSINPEKLKVVYDDLMLEYGVNVMFMSQVCGVDADNGVVNGVIVSNKKGLTYYTAKIFVDASADADIVAWAGGAYALGGQSGELQSATHCFQLSNVDMYYKRTDTNLHGGNPESPIHRIVNDGRFSLINDSHFCYQDIDSGTVGFNAGHICGLISDDIEAYSKAMMTGRKMAGQFRDALAERLPATYGASFVSQTAPAMGIRESRRILGDYVITYQDWLETRSFPDEIGRNSYFIDAHSAKSGEALEKLEITKTHYEKGESHGIPYRALTPVNLKNVIVAGRTVSADKLVQASIRVMPPCLVTGEAAGQAASIGIAGNVYDMHKIDVAKLRTQLRKEGAYFE
jgi:hypothetical protein